MAYQIVATSVPRGLDGVSGYQTVLKSQGIPPRVFDRLKARAGYSHPYSHGDPRNPVVYLHRIEELAGSRWHVLGCIRDAGSDHTGRSNFLAHMLGVEAGEARSKPGGPAAAAMAGGCFLTKWDGPPDGTALPKTLVAGDLPPAAGDLPAWKTAGLDLGIAGDLAAAAMRNEKVVLVTRPSDDVLALFADAMRLVEPSKRWGVTFNTCAMEDFDGTWKAVRNDLVDAKNVRTGKAAVIDLTAGERGSEDPYAQFARGDKSSLPWQKFSRAVAAPPADSSPPESPVAASNLPSPVDDRHVLPGAPPASPSPTRERARRPRYIEKDEPSHVPWHFITTACLFLLIGGGGAAIFFREQLFGSTTPARPPVSARDRELAAELDLPSVVKPAPPGQGDVSTVPAQGGAIVSQQEASNQLAEKRAEITEQLKNGRYASLRTKGSDLRTKVAELRSTYAAEWETLVTSDGNHRDPSPAVDQIRRAFDELDDAVSDVDKVLGSRILVPLDELNEHQATLTAADEKVASAAAGLDELQTQVRDLEADLRERQAENRQEEAFKDFQTLAKAVSLPAASTSKEIDLGPFRIADLIDPTVRLAVPRDLDEGDSIKVFPDDGERPAAWEIRYLPGAVGLDNAAQRPRVLASLSARDGRLILQPAMVETSLSSLLRRCVLLVEAKPPVSPESSGVVQQIRLVKATAIGPIAIDPFEAKRQVVSFAPPEGIKRSVRVSRGSGSYADAHLPLRSMRFEAALYREGEVLREEIAFTFTESDTDAVGEAFAETERVLFDLESPVYHDLDLKVVAKIQLTLAQSTLAVNAEFAGANKGDFDMRAVRKEYVDNPEAALKELRRLRGVQLEKILKIDLASAQTVEGTSEVKKWFSAQNFFGAQHSKVMKGHEMRWQSFELFLKEKYDSASREEERKPEKERKGVDLPQTFEAFRQECEAAANPTAWDRQFLSRLRSWDEWFWPQFESHWQGVVKMFQGAAAETYDLRVSGVISLAYDENGEEYEVPLVVLDESAAPVDGPASSGGGTPVGLD